MNSAVGRYRTVTVVALKTVFVAMCRCFAMMEAQRKLSNALKWEKYPKYLFIFPMKSMLIEREYGAVEFDCVTFVPMTRIKEMRRGFNHAELIAKRVSDNLHLPMRSLLKRSLGIHSQKSLNSVNRYKNVRGKFHTVKSVQGMTVLLVDDVITTGATLSECALQLKSAGAAAVFSATFASTYKK